MPSYRFASAEVTAEHRRSPVRAVELRVEIPKETTACGGLEFLQTAQIVGEFAIDCPTSENRLRPGQLVNLKLTGSDGRFTRPAVLLTRLARVEPVDAKTRRYIWEFLVPARPGHDPQGLFRREGEPPPPRPEEAPREFRGRWNRPPLPLKPIRELDPEATELSLGQLLEHLGATLDTPAVRFTAEGGIVLPTSEAGHGD